MQNLSRRNRHLATNAWKDTHDISISGTYNRPMRVGANRIEAVESSLEAPCARGRNFLTGLTAHLLQLYTKDVGRKRRKDSSKGYVIGAIELSERKGTK